MQILLTLSGLRALSRACTLAALTFASPLPPPPRQGPSVLLHPWYQSASWDVVDVQHMPVNSEGCETSNCALHVVIKKMGKDQTSFLAPGNLAIVLLAVSISLALPWGKVTTISILAGESPHFQEIYAE